LSIAISIYFIFNNKNNLVTKVYIVAFPFGFLNLERIRTDL
jgi:hypothetical protein